jgi:very-short-patch-repair endonuclease
MASTPRSRKTQPRLKKAENAKLEEKFAFQLQQLGLIKRFTRNYAKAIPGSRMEIDFADVENRIAIEIQGGTWAKGKMGHNSGVGIRRDCIKSNMLQLNGWRILKVTSDMIRDTTAIDFIERFYSDALSYTMPSAGAAVTGRTTLQLGNDSRS